MHRRCRRHSFIQLRQNLWSGLAGDDSGNTYCVCGRINFKESLAKWISLVSLMWRFIVCRRNTFFYREAAAQRLYWIMGWMLNYVAEDWMGEHFHHNSKHDHTFVTGQEQWTLCSKVYPRLLWTPGDIRTSTCVLLPVLKVKQQSLITIQHINHDSVYWSLRTMPLRSLGPCVCRSFWILLVSVNKTSIAVLHR